MLTFWHIGCHGSKNASQKSKSQVGQPLSPEERDIRQDKINSAFVDACTYMMQGEAEKAISSFQAVLGEDARNHAAMYNIARLQYERKAYNEAIPYLQDAITLDKTNYWYRTLLRDVYFAQGDIRGVVQTQEQLVAQFGQKPDDAITLAAFYVEGNRLDDALRMLQIAEEKGEITENLLLKKVQLLNKINRPEEVPALTQRLIMLNPENADYYRLQYNAYNDIKQPQAARNTLRQLLNNEPENGFALLTLSDNYRAAGVIDSADMYLFKVFKNPLVDESLKIVYLRQEIATIPKSPANAQRVEALLNTLNEAHPNSYNAALLHAELLASQGNNAGALNAYRQLLTLNGNNESGWLLLVQDDYRHKDFVNLLKDSENALEYFPNNETFLFYFGISSLQAAALDEAIYAFEKICKKGSLNADILALTHLQLGKAYSKKNNLSAALAQWQMAEGAFVKFVTEKPKNPGYLEGYGDVLYLLDRRSEAVLQWQNAIENGAKFTIQEKEKELM